MTDVPLLGDSVHGRLGTSARIEDGEFIVDLTPTSPVLNHGRVRASVVALVVDVVAGLSIDDDPEAWALTTDLSVRMQPVPAPRLLSATSTTVRRGARTAVCSVDVVAGGTSVGHGVGGFARVPRRPHDPPKPIFTPKTAVERFGSRGTLDIPLREAVGVGVVDAAEGVVEVEVTAPLLNPNGTLQGAMIAFIAETAAEELIGARFDVPAVVTDLDLRYLARIERGVVRSRCRLIGDRPDATVAIELLDVAKERVTTLVYARAAQPGLG